MEKTANCLRIGNGANRKVKKQTPEDTRQIIMFFEIRERISKPFFRAGFPFQCVKK